MISQPAGRRELRKKRSSFAVFTLTMVALFVGLGVWQLQRRAEKHALIAALTERLSAAPTPLPAALAWDRLTPQHDEFRRVTFLVTFPDAPSAAVYSSGSALRADVTGLGTFVFGPVLTADGQAVVVDRGFVPEGKIAAAVPGGQVQLTGYLRFPEASGWLTPQPDIGQRLWFARDHRGMARALNWGV